MQASFNSSQLSYSMNSPNIPMQRGAFQPPPPPQAFSQQSSMQYSQNSFSREFGGNSMSGSSSSYFSQQMSQGPSGFNNSIFSASSFAFNQRGWGAGDPRAMGSWGQGCNAYGNGGFGQRDAWSDTGVSGNKAAINLGSYTLNFDKSNSSMVLTDARTGNQTKIWGDPHIDLNDGTANKSSGMFNGPLTFNLPNHTRVSVGTQPAGNNSNVSYADNVTITQGNRAYVVNGLSEQDSTPLTVQRSRDGFALSQQVPQDSMNLYATRGGTGWINAATQAPVKASDFA